MAIANSQMRVIARNLCPSSTLASAPEIHNIASMGVSNLGNSSRTLSFRSTAIEEDDVVEIHAELQDPEFISGIVIDGHNLQVGDTWRVVLYTGPDKTGTEWESDWQEVFDSKILGEIDWGIDALAAGVFRPRDRKFSNMWVGLRATQGLTVQIRSEGNPHGFVEVNRLVFGRAVSPNRNFSYGYEWDVVSSSSSEYSEGGSHKVTPGVERRVLRLSLPRLDDGTERASFADVLTATAGKSDMFISLFPDQGGQRERDHAIVGYLKAHSPLRSRSATAHTIELTIEET